MQTYRKVNLQGEGADFARNGLEILKDDLPLRQDASGIRVTLKRGEELSLRLQPPEGVAITYTKQVEIFRALAKGFAHDDITAFCERPSFKKNGAMLDCSRNAVAKVETACYLLRKMALMGLSVLMLYTEDTYTVPEQPYFGYCRGRYTPEEIRAMDDAAYALGIELMPCIQTLAHLKQFLRWPSSKHLRDDEQILLAGEDSTYEVIEQMLVAASGPYRSRRIHIGMDEAWGLGTGQYYEKHGFVPKKEIMGRHLARVDEILRRLGLEAIMWSDMHFFVLPGGRYDHQGLTHMPKEIIEAAPANIGLVYWDYYHEDAQTYDAMLSLHRQFEAKTLFAGGIWTWYGPTVDYEKTMRATVPALSQCMRHGIQEVIATAWGDNGGECSPLSILFGLQMFAEIDYQGTFSLEHIKRAFQETLHLDPDAFLAISRFNNLPGILPRDVDRPVNPLRHLLYEDPLIPLFEADYDTKNLVGYFETLSCDLSRYAQENNELRPLFCFYAKLAECVALKCTWRNAAAPCIRQGDRGAAGALLALADANIQGLKDLRVLWYDLWHRYCKPFGFEVLDIRVGGLISRFDTAKRRMEGFARKELEDIPELSCEKIPFVKNGEGRMYSRNIWREMVSAGEV